MLEDEEGFAEVLEDEEGFAEVLEDEEGFAEELEDEAVEEDASHLPWFRTVSSSLTVFLLLK